MDIDSLAHTGQAGGFDFMGESRMISTYKEKVWYRNELKIGVA